MPWLLDAIVCVALDLFVSFAKFLQKTYFCFIIIIIVIIIVIIIKLP